MKHFLTWILDDEDESPNPTVVMDQDKTEIPGPGLFKLDGQLYQAIPIHSADECSHENCQYITTPPPPPYKEANISMSLAVALGLSWMEEDEGEQLEEGAAPNGGDWHYKVIPCYLVPTVEE